MKTKLIPWESVEVGDKIRSTFTYNDAVKTTQGVIAYVLAVGKKRSFYTKQGVKVFTVEIGVKAGLTVELINRPVEPQKETLF